MVRGQGEMMDWINVDDRIPEPKTDEYSESVLAVDAVGQMFVAWIDYEDEPRWNSDVPLPDFQRITHWMPLPSPPQG